MPRFEQFHMIHMTDDVPALDAWYDDMFNPRRGWHEDNQYMELERRNASLIDVADICLEPLSPSFQVDDWATFPLGRFYNRFGSHWHWIAFFTDDVAAVAKGLDAAGVQYFGHAGRPGSPEDYSIFTHPPRDTIAQLQFMTMGSPPGLYNRDPRFLPGWDPRWWSTNHPLGLVRAAYTTVLAREPGRAYELYTSVLGATPLERETYSALTGTRNAYVALGDTVIEFAAPTDASSLAAQDLERSGQIMHALALRVRDLAGAESYLKSKGVGILARDAATLLADPATTKGVPFRFTTEDIAGDPRGPA